MSVHVFLLLLTFTLRDGLPVVNVAEYAWHDQNNQANFELDFGTDRLMG